MKYDFNKLIQIGTGNVNRLPIPAQGESKIEYECRCAKWYNGMNMNRLKLSWRHDWPDLVEIKSMDQTKLLAAQNDPQALFSLGTHAYWSFLRFLWQKKAFEYFYRAAQLGHEEARYWSGCWLLRGYGTKKDVQQATKYLMESKKGQRTLARAYILGKGVPRDFNKAFDIAKETLYEFKVLFDGEMVTVESLLQNNGKDKTSKDKTTIKTAETEITPKNFDVENANTPNESVGSYVFNEEAVLRLLEENEIISAALLQNKFKVGYSDAAKMILALSEKGYIVHTENGWVKA